MAPFHDEARQGPVITHWNAGPLSTNGKNNSRPDPLGFGAAWNLHSHSDARKAALAPVLSLTLSLMRAKIPLTDGWIPSGIMAAPSHLP
jgi:hypothetical protein